MLQGSYQGLTITRVQARGEEQWLTVGQADDKTLPLSPEKVSSGGRAQKHLLSGFLLDSPEPSMTLMNHRCSINKQRYFSEWIEIQNTFLESQCFGGVQFSRSVMSDPLRPHGLQDTRPPCPSPTSGVYSNSYPLNWWWHPTIILCHSFLPPSIFPNIRVFSNESALRIRWPK